MEVAYHRGKELQEIQWEEAESFSYFLSDFRGELHDVRGGKHFAKCLDPNSYKVSQRLASGLLERGSAGVVYPSVRHKGGTCVACFRPALGSNVWKGARISISFANAFAKPEIREVR